MNVALIEKSSDRLKLSLYSDSLAIIESESFDDLYTLNFYLQALGKKHVIEKWLLGCTTRIRTQSTCQSHGTKIPFLSARPVIPVRHCNLHGGVAGGTLGPAAAAKVQPVKATFYIGAL